MNKLIATKCAESLLADLPFVDKITGIVKQGNITTAGVTKSIPIAVDAAEFGASEGTGVYSEFVPDSSKDSIIYFEDLGANAVNHHHKWIEYEGIIKLVCWFDYTKTKPLLHDTSWFVAEVLKQMPKKFKAFECFTAMFCTFRDQDPRDGAVFTKYTYFEDLTQFWTYPYDYFSLNFDTAFRIHEDCFDWAAI